MKKLTIATSESNPYLTDHIFCVNNQGLFDDGDLYIGFAPGKWEYQDSLNLEWRRNLRLDLQLIKDKGITQIICLVEDSELEELRIPNYVNIAKEFGITVVRYPFPDHHPPPNNSETKYLVNELCSKLMSGEKLLVHCKGGVGRAPTITVCILIHLGVNLDSSLKIVKERRKNCLKNKKQLQFLSNYTQ